MRILIPIVLSVMVSISVMASSVIWTQDCQGVVSLTPIQGGQHVICSEGEPTPASSGILPVMAYVADSETLNQSGVQAAEGELVARWGNIAGTTADLEPLSGSVQRMPTLIENVINGHSVVSFDGIGNVLRSDQTLVGDAGTIIVVFRMTEPWEPPIPTMLRLHSDGAGNGYERIAIVWNHTNGPGLDSNYRASVNGGKTQPIDNVTIRATDINPGSGWHMLTFSWSHSVGIMQTRVDRMQIGGATISVPWIGDPDEIVVAAKASGGAHAMAVDIAELRIYNKFLNAADVLEAENGLFNKYFL